MLMLVDVGGSSLTEGSFVGVSFFGAVQLEKEKLVHKGLVS